MKKLNFLIVLLVLLTLAGLAQVPDAFNYQAVVRNSSGEVISNQTVSFRISILKNSNSGTVVFSETQNTQTNNFGLVTLKIGKGTRVSGSFDPASWGSNSHFIKIEFDATGGTSYTLLGTSELLSVPYAFHAQTVEIDNVNDADADASNEIQTLNLSGTQLSLSKGGGSVILPSSGGGDNWGTQTVVSDATLSGNGTTASPLRVDGDLTDNQTLSINGYELSISDGNSVFLPSESVIWRKNGLNIYYNIGNIGIGTDSPQRQLEIYEPNSINAVAKFKSVGGDAILELERGDWLGKAYTAYKNGGSATLYSGMLGLGNNDFSLSFDNSTLKGIKISQAGDTYISGNLLMEGGKLGIGTTSPTEKLDVHGNITLPYGYGYQLKGSGVNFSVENEGTGVAFINRAASFMKFYTTPTENGSPTARMYLSSNGNIGMGNILPRQKLHISDGNIMLENNYGIRLFNTTNLTDADGFSELKTDGKDLYLVNNIPTGSIYFGVAATGVQTKRLIIDKSGRIGIGQIYPESGLHIYGSGFPNSFIYIQSNSGQDAGIRLYEGSNAKWHIFNNSAAGGLQIYNTAGQTAIFAKQSNSYIGIGTTAPTQALHVVGNAYKTSGGTSWATSSDIRLKNVLGNYSKGLAEITALQAVRYIYKKDNPKQLNSDIEQVGFVAQEVQKIFPEAVSVGEDGYLDFNIHPINIAFVNAFKELKSENEQLKSKLNNLELRLAEMESLVKASAFK